MLEAAPAPLTSAVAAQYSLDPLQQKGTREWFPDEIVCSHLEAEQFVYFFSLGRQKDHRQVGTLA